MNEDQGNEKKEVQSDKRDILVINATEIGID